jgi:hypothetical protein
MKDLEYDSHNKAYNKPTCNSNEEHEWKVLLLRKSLSEQKKAHNNGKLGQPISEMIKRPWSGTPRTLGSFNDRESCQEQERERKNRNKTNLEVPKRL